MYCKLENKTDTVKKFTFSHAISIFISRLKKKKNAKVLVKRMMRRRCN